MATMKLIPLSVPRDPQRLVYAPPSREHPLRECAGDAVVVCGRDACDFVFGIGLDPSEMTEIAFRCPACGTESEFPRYRVAS